MTQLLEWVEEHEIAFSYDWRTRFGLSLRVVGTAVMPWREAWSLTVALLEDPSSRVAVAVGRWDRPWSQTDAVLADIYDLTLHINTEKSKRAQAPSYPRPAQAKAQRVRDPRVDAAWRAHLRRVGHTVGVDPPVLTAAPALPELTAGPQSTTSPGEEVILG